MGGFPCGSTGGKESTCNIRDLGSIPGLGRSPGEGKGYPLKYSGLENSLDYIVHGITKSQTRLSDLHFNGKWRSLQLSWEDPGKNTGVSCHFLLHWTNHVLYRNLHYYPFVLDGPVRYGS